MVQNSLCHWFQIPSLHVNINHPSLKLPESSRHSYVYPFQVIMKEHNCCGLQRFWISCTINSAINTDQLSVWFWRGIVSMTAWDQLSKSNHRLECWAAIIWMWLSNVWHTVYAWSSQQWYIQIIHKNYGNTEIKGKKWACPLGSSEKHSKWSIWLLPTKAMDVVLWCCAPSYVLLDPAWSPYSRTSAVPLPQVALQCEMSRSGHGHEVQELRQNSHVSEVSVDSRYCITANDILKFSSNQIVVIDKLCSCGAQ